MVEQTRQDWQPSRPASSAHSRASAGVITPQEMREMARSMRLRPKTARWIGEHDHAIFQEPIGTFREAAKAKWAPTFAFGTGTRFEVTSQAGQSHNRETCGPALGPGYDVVRAFEATLPKTYTAAMARPISSKNVDNRPRWQDPNVDRTEGSDVTPYPMSFESPCFKRAAQKSYHGQAPYANRTGCMGTGPRFTHKGGLAGNGNKSHFNAFAGDCAPILDIRRWPEPARQVRRAVTRPGGGSSSRLEFPRGGEAPFAAGEGCGSYDIPSTFDYAKRVSSKPTSSFGTARGGSTFR